MGRRSDNYSADEVRALVEGYDELRYYRSKQWIMVRLADLDLAMHKLPRAEYEAVLLCGLIGLSTRWAGDILGVSKDTVHRRYLRGLAWLVAYINGRRR